MQDDKITISFEVSTSNWKEFLEMVDHMNNDCPVNEKATPEDILRLVVVDKQYVEDYYNY